MDKVKDITDDNILCIALDKAISLAVMIGRPCEKEWFKCDCKKDMCTSADCYGKIKQYCINTAIEKDKK